MVPKAVKEAPARKTRHPAKDLLVRIVLPQAQMSPAARGGTGRTMQYENMPSIALSRLYGQIPDAEVFETIHCDMVNEPRCIEPGPRNAGRPLAAQAHWPYRRQ